MQPETILNNYILRFLNNGDLNDYFDIIDRNRTRLEDFFAGTVAMTRTLEDTAVHLNDVVSKCEQNNYFPFVVTDNETGKIIASIQVKSIDWSIPKAEIGYYIDAGYEGKGIITKAVTHIINFCFDEQGFNKLYIRTHAGNTSSRRVAEKNGFIIEGNIRKDYKTTKGEIIDTLYYGLVREDVM